jgi:hypothetical protein
MTRPEQTWREKQLAKEEGGSNSDSSGKGASRVTPTRGEDNPRSGDGKPESDNCNPESGNCHLESGNRNLNSGSSDRVRRMTGRERSQS